MFNSALNKGISVVTGPFVRALAAVQQGGRCDSSTIPTVRITEAEVDGFLGVLNGKTPSDPALAKAYNDQVFRTEEAVRNSQGDGGLPLRAQYDRTTGAPTRALGHGAQDLLTKGYLQNCPLRGEVFAVGCHPSVFTSSEAKGKLFTVAEQDAEQLNRMKDHLLASGFVKNDSPGFGEAGVESFKDPGSGTEVTLHKDDAVRLLRNSDKYYNVIVDSNAVNVYSSDASAFNELAKTKLRQDGAFYTNIVSKCQSTYFPNGTQLGTVDQQGGEVVSFSEYFSGIHGPSTVRFSFNSQSVKEQFFRGLQTASARDIDIGPNSSVRHGLKWPAPNE